MLACQPCRDRAGKSRDAFHGFAAWSEAEAASPQVTRDGVVRRALELLNEDGFDGLTMRRLAEKLGIKAASLYNHVKDKDELLALMANAICAEIPDLDHTRPWREQAERMALQVRTVLMAHRDGARVLAATPPVGPHRLRLIEQLLHALVGAGLSRARVVDAAFVMNSYVVGFVLDETLGYPADTASAETDARGRKAVVQIASQAAVPDVGGFRRRAGRCTCGPALQARPPRTARRAPAGVFEETKAGPVTPTFARPARPAAPGISRMNRATCAGSSIWTKCRAPGTRNSSDPGKSSWKRRATPVFRYGSASPKMIRTGRLNSGSFGSIFVRERIVGNKSSFKRKKAGRALGVASNC